MTNKKYTKDNKLLIVVIFFSTFICFFNQTTINPALPTIISDFEITASTAQWLLSGYLMIMAIMIPINAFMVERYSIKNLCIVAMGIYVVGCFFTGSGVNFFVTLWGRILQGVGHGILMPTCMAAMLYIFPLDKRGTIFGIYGLLVGFAPVLGPTFSGIVVDNISWHFVFYCVGIFSFLCFLGCIFLMPNFRINQNSSTMLDIPSLFLSTIGFGVVLFGCSEIGANGFSVIGIGSIILGGIVVAIFFVRQGKIEYPMLEIKIFKIWNFTLSIVLIFICQLAFMGAIVLFPFLIQDVLGQTPTVSGLVMIAPSLIIGVMSPVTGKLFDKYGIRWIGPFGMFFLTAAGVCLSFIQIDSPIWLLIVFLCVRNFGASFVLMNTNTWGINSLPDNLLPHGNAVASTFRQIAMSFGAAISTSVYTLVSNSLPGGIANPESAIVGINCSFFYQACLCLFALILFFICVRDVRKK